MPGVAAMVDNVLSRTVDEQDIPELCLRQMGNLEVKQSIRHILGETVEKSGEIDRSTIQDLFRVIAASPEYQRC
jgi:hypothetical protein